MKLWSKGELAHRAVDKFTVGNDRSYDQILAKYDCIASIAHTKMLAKVGILTNAEAEQLIAELQKIQADAEAGNFQIEADFEDMHSKIEYLLCKNLGAVGKKIHSARSRNDQVLVVLHLFAKAELNIIKAKVIQLFNLLLTLAEQHQHKLLPGYTHLQVAMPSSFGLWFSAYAEALCDDMLHWQSAYSIANQNPLGSAAGYGSSFNIDRQYTTELLDFEYLRVNSVAAQMSRGRLEQSVVSFLSFLAGSLSKLAMDICLYLNQDFNFISFPDNLTTGSSIMPHKKNPDLFELVRGKCNVVQSLPNQLALLMSNLPSGYHRELQLTKQPLLEGLETINSCLDILLFSLPQVVVKDNITEQTKYDFLFSVDTLNAEVEAGKSFRDAYKQLGIKINNGDYSPKRNIEHSHIGSIGNLRLDLIKQKMQKFTSNDKYKN